MQQTYVLPERLDTGAASDLAAALRAQPPEPLTIDASAVQSIGALCMQVLVSAALQWNAYGARYRIVEASAGLAEGCRILGVPLTAIGAETQKGEDQ